MTPQEEAATFPAYLDGWINCDDPIFDCPLFVLNDNTEFVDAILSGEIEP